MGVLEYVLFTTKHWTLCDKIMFVSLPHIIAMVPPVSALVMSIVMGRDLHSEAPHHHHNADNAEQVPAPGLNAAN